MLTGQANQGSAQPFLRAAGTWASPQKNYSPPSSLVVWGLERLPLILLPRWNEARLLLQCKY